MMCHGSVREAELSWTIRIKDLLQGLNLLHLWERVDWAPKAVALASTAGTRIAIGQSDQQLGRNAWNGQE